MGIEMRELSEFNDMEEYKPILKEIQVAINEKKFAAGADMARLLVLHAYGGVYTDQDHQIREYDTLLNKLDFWTYFYENIGYNTVENSMIGAAKGNKFIKRYIDSIVYVRTIRAAPLFESSCL